MEELKPCPFCGGEAVIREWYIRGTANRKHYRVECKNCGARCTAWEYNRINKAIAAWNRRAGEEAEKALEGMG